MLGGEILGREKELIKERLTSGQYELSVGPMPEPEKAKLDEVVAKAHKYARKVRFWNAPDQPVFWSELLAHKVDLINTDHLEEVRKFLANRRSSP